LDQLSPPTHIVIPGLVPGIHFPETAIVLLRLWKMGGRDKPGHDELFWKNKKMHKL
jgi:hypothetical protein